jgi:hypothetical protein
MTNEELLIQKAQNPATPPEQLAAMLSDPLLTKKITKNPNTPKELLFRLALQHLDVVVSWRGRS